MLILSCQHTPCAFAAEVSVCTAASVIYAHGNIIRSSYMYIFALHQCGQEKLADVCNRFGNAIMEPVRHLTSVLATSSRQLSVCQPLCTKDGCIAITYTTREAGDYPLGAIRQGLNMLLIKGISLIA